MLHGTTLALLVTMANLTGVVKRTNAIRYTQIPHSTVGLSCLGPRTAMVTLSLLGC